MAAQNEKKAPKQTRLWLALVIGLMSLIAAAPAWAQEDDATKSVVKALEGVKLGILGYVDYSAGEMALPGNQHQPYNKFSLTRGYLTVTKDVQPWLGMRFTSDISQDTKTADGTYGSYLLRVKYLYGELRPRNFGPFTENKAEIGMGHIPWLDFEENLNPYRCQGTMAIERAGVLASADTGVSLRGNLGGKLEDAEKRTGDKNYDGKFGSWHLGVYNGGGYAAEERNQNKVIEGRVSLRPLPGIVPGLQLSYFGVIGEGNDVKGDVVAGTTLKEVPKYNVNLGMLSYEHPMVTVTGQYFTTQGNAKGSWVNPKGKALDTSGYSAFARLSVPGTKDKLSLLGRYDGFNPDPDNKYSDEASYTMWFAGLAYDLSKGNLILVDYEATDYQKDSGGKTALPKAGNKLGDDTKLQVVYQLKF
jgi:hypothetical protein